MTGLNTTDWLITGLPGYNVPHRVGSKFAELCNETRAGIWVRRLDFVCVGFLLFNDAANIKQVINFILAI